MPIVLPKPVSAEQLLGLGDIGRCELIAGEIVSMAPTSFDHGDIASDLVISIGVFVKRKRLGKVVTAEAGFRIRRNPDTVRAPDVGFVRKERSPRRGSKGFFEGAPDLAIEILSPSDRKSQVLAKAKDWLEAGARSVWLVDPSRQMIEVHRPGSKVLRFSGTDVLENEPTLPGFALSLADLFTGD